MNHPIGGRHRRTHHTLAARVWAVTAALLATALACLFYPSVPPVRPTTVPPLRPRGQAKALLPETLPEGNSRQMPSQHKTARAAGAASVFESGADPDHTAGALIRPYMSGIALPSPRQPADDSAPPGEFEDLAAVIRTYLVVVGRA